MSGLPAEITQSVLFLLIILLQLFDFISLSDQTSLTEWLRTDNHVIQWINDDNLSITYIIHIQMKLKQLCYTQMQRITLDFN